MQFTAEKNALTARRGGETLRIEGWGRDSLRVRAVMYDGWTGNDWALTEMPEAADCKVQTGRDTDGTPCAQIRNGRITATVNFAGVLSFFRDGELILREYYRSYPREPVPENREPRMEGMHRRQRIPADGPV